MLKGILNIRIEHVLKGEPGTERQSTRKWHMEFDQNDVTLWWWYFVHLLCWGQELFNCTKRKSTLFPSVSCSLSQRTDLYGYQRVLPMGNFNRKWEGEKRVRIGCLDCLPAGFPWVVCIAWLKSSFLQKAFSRQSRESYTTHAEGPVCFPISNPSQVGIL